LSHAVSISTIFLFQFFREQFLPRRGPSTEIIIKRRKIQRNAVEITNEEFAAATAEVQAMQRSASNKPKKVATALRGFLGCKVSSAVWYYMSYGVN
jgi:hypothetical protein